MTPGRAMNAILEEFSSASLKYGKFNSAHEGYAILLEEVDELWDEVKKKSSQRDGKAMTQEAMQVAAMAMRFMVDMGMEDDV